MVMSWNPASNESTSRGFGPCTADDREAFRAELPPGADERLAIPVSGVKQLRLGTDFGLRGDLGDYVNWCDLLLIGERQGTVAPATRPNDAE